MLSNTEWGRTERKPTLRSKSARRWSCHRPASLSDRSSKTSQHGEKLKWKNIGINTTSGIMKREKSKFNPRNDTYEDVHQVQIYCRICSSYYCSVESAEFAGVYNPYMNCYNGEKSKTHLPLFSKLGVYSIYIQGRVKIGWNPEKRFRNSRGSDLNTRCVFDVRTDSREISLDTSRHKIDNTFKGFLNGRFPCCLSD